MVNLLRAPIVVLNVFVVSLFRGAHSGGRGDGDGRAPGQAAAARVGRHRNNSSSILSVECCGAAEGGGGGAGAGGAPGAAAAAVSVGPRARLGCRFFRVNRVHLPARVDRQRSD